LMPLSSAVTATVVTIIASLTACHCCVAIPDLGQQEAGKGVAQWQSLDNC
jgi:hypothetical protein